MKESIYLGFRRRFFIQISSLFVVVITPLIMPESSLASDVTLFSQPASTKLVFEPIQEPGPCLNPPCAPPTRKFIYAIWIEIYDSKREEFDHESMDMAAGTVAKSFSSSAIDSLNSYTDSTAIGWTDVWNEICRSHQRKPSLVLPAPYFENVEYCISLIPAPSWSWPWARVFRLRAEASITLTKNPASSYREPDLEEITPYGEILVKFVEGTKTQLANILVEEGWKVSKSEEQIRISERKN